MIFKMDDASICTRYEVTKYAVARELLCLLAVLSYSRVLIYI